MTMKIGCDGIDLSLLNPTQFKLSFSKIPNVEFFCQSIILPEISLGTVIQNTPLLDVFHHGEKVRHQPLYAEVLLDKQMRTYSEIYKWMKDLSVMYGAAESSSECVVTIGEKSFTFHDVFPINLASVNLNIAVTDVQAVAFGITFEYDYFSME